MRRFVKRRVVAHTKDGQSIRGVLLSNHRDCVVIDQPEYLGQAPDEHKLEGDAVILKDNLAWVQVL